MKYILLFLPLLLFGGDYFAKVEPFEAYTISSNVAGLVTYTNENLVSKVASDEVVIKIDDELAQINYDIALQTFNTRKRLYNNLLKVKTKSQTAKDNEKLLYLSAKQALINAKDNLKHRKIKANGLYIAKILVKKGGYVNYGTPLIEAFDTSRSKITIFVTKEDIIDIENRKIVVGGKEDYTLYKYFTIADKQKITSYQVELVGKAPKNFSKIVKVEIK